MLLDLHALVRKHKLRIKGVVHAGAHHGEEYKDYTRYTRNVIFIEPAKEAIEVLKLKFPQVKLYECALGASETTLTLNTEKHNKGQSNSLLKPAKHLEQYPDIIFDDSQTVNVNKLDNLGFDRNYFNFLAMDIQGYELEALKGATWTLDHIDYIYCEVNRDEVYEGCARVEQLDEYLKKWNFQRIETNWGGGTWGDALYIKRKVTTLQNNFKPQPKIVYPEDNRPYFEEWYSKNRTEVEGWEYLDVWWTALYVNRNERGRIRIDDIQRYLDSLDRTKKYYTVVQYDDGILNKVNHLNLRVYAMSGNRIDYPLPLICQPHPFKFDFERNILANFIGGETHPIRKEIFKLKGQPNLYISQNKHSLESFCHILSTSIFTLCPRGYGATSFRICEAMQYGSIPVYISDKFIVPHNLNFMQYGVFVPAKGITNLESVLNEMSKDEIESKQGLLKTVYANYFTFEANKKLIEDDLKKQL